MPEHSNVITEPEPCPVLRSGRREHDYVSFHGTLEGKDPHGLYAVLAQHGLDLDEDFCIWCLEERTA